MKEIKLLVLDLDGVITDGTVTISEDGKESKRFCFHDLDAVSSALNAGLKVAVITGEETAIVKIITDRFGINKVITGAKDKLKALKTLSIEYDISLENICYVGDSDRDAPAIFAAGLGIAPSNASSLAKSSANIVLQTPGGSRAVADVVRLLLDGNKKN